MFAGAQNLSVPQNENYAYFPSSLAGSFYTRSTLCVGLLVVLAATLRIGEASRAAASAEAGLGSWDFSSCWSSAWSPAETTLALIFQAVARPTYSRARHVLPLRKKTDPHSWPLLCWVIPRTHGRG